MKSLKSNLLFAMALMLFASMLSSPRVGATEIQTSSYVTHEGTLQLYSHGKPGYLLLDGKWKNAEEIAAYIESNFTKVKNINIYGCNFAKGKEGLKAVKIISQKLNTPVSASDDITGVDGDWILEVGPAEQVLKLRNFNENLQTCGGPIGSMADNGDFDGDGVCNAADYDDDNDGIPDIYEDQANGTCNGIYLPVTGISCYNPGINPNTGNSNHVLSSSELDRISDVNSGTGYQATYNGLPYINSLYYTNESATVSEIRIYNWSLSSYVGQTNQKHVASIDKIELYNALGEVVYTTPAKFYPTTTSSSHTFYSITLPAPVEGVTRMLVKNLKSSAAGFGLRDIFLVGCKSDFDGDGFPNKFDTDSDGDGCPDAVESNAVSSTQGYTFDQLDGRSMVDLPIGTTSTQNTYGVPDANRNNSVGAYDANTQSTECDACNAGSTLFADFDGDLIGDACDLDADNDGILNDDECPGVGSFTHDYQTYLDLNGAVVLPDSDPNDYIGPSLFKTGAQTLPDGTCIDLLIEVQQLTTNSSPSFNWNLTPTNGTKLFIGGNNDYKFTVSYYECGTTTPVELSTIYRITDLDGDGDWNGDFIIDCPDCNNTSTTFVSDDYVYVGRGEYIDYITYAPTLVYPVDAGPFTYFYSLGVNNYSYSCVSGIAPVDTTTQTVFIKFKKASEFDFYYHGGQFGGIFMDFTYEAAIACDSDQDGIPDYLDKDSDNDGCPDALESESNSYNSTDLNADTTLNLAVDLNPSSSTYGVPASQAYPLGSSQDSTINPCQGFLALENLEINLSTENCQSTINWNIEDRPAYSTIELQRSKGTQGFQTIYTAKENETSGSYTDLEVDLSQTDYVYRLTLIDGNQAQYSRSLLATGASCRDAKSIKVLPNPANNEIRIVANGYRSGDQLMIAIYNQFGQLVQSQEVNVNNASISQSMDISNVAAGTYQVIIHNKTSRDMKSQILNVIH